VELTFDGSPLRHVFRFQPLDLGEVVHFHGGREGLVGRGQSIHLHINHAIDLSDRQKGQLCGPLHKLETILPQLHARGKRLC
jgi:hypothetical protein